MSGIRGKNTKPEILLRSLLHRKGFRFRLHGRNLPGRPDIVLPASRVAIFVHGCFWHQHEGCRYSYHPASNKAFWTAKFRTNVRRDRLNQSALERAGWRFAVVWECALRSNPRGLARLTARLDSWIRSTRPWLELPAHRFSRLGRRRQGIG